MHKKALVEATWRALRDNLAGIPARHLGNGNKKAGRPRGSASQKEASQPSSVVFPGTV